LQKGAQLAIYDQLIYSQFKAKMVVPIALVDNPENQSQVIDKVISDTSASDKQNWMQKGFDFSLIQMQIISNIKNQSENKCKHHKTVNCCHW